MRDIIVLILRAASERKEGDVLSNIGLISFEVDKEILRIMWDIREREQKRGSRFDEGDLEAYAIEYYNRP